jgi:hypothetical protein
MREILGQTFLMLAKYPMMFLGIALVASVPIAGIRYIAGRYLSFLFIGGFAISSVLSVSISNIARQIPEKLANSPSIAILTSHPANVAFMIFSCGVVLFFALLVEAMILYAVRDFIAGERPQFKLSAALGLPRVLIVTVGLVLTVVFCNLLTWGIIIATMFLLFLSFGRSEPGMGTVAMIGGTNISGPIMIIAIVVLMCLWFAFVPVCVAERRGPIGALGRSMALTSRYCGNVFCLMALTCFFSWSFRQIAIWLLQALSIDDLPATVFVVGFFDAVSAVFFAVLASVAYYEMRRAKDGVSVESLMN